MATYSSGGAPGAQHDHHGRLIDFGRTAEDYGRHRPGFPSTLFDALEARRWMRVGQRALDLGTGTGSLALGLAARGLRVAALDPAPELLAVARRRADELGLDLRLIEAVAEKTGEPDGSYELVTAGQCWWWLDSGAAAAEIGRVLVPGGRVLIASFCYLPMPNTVAGDSEALLLRVNPGWPGAWSMGIFPDQLQALAAGGFREIESFSYDVPVSFTHEAWRGRMRACNGVKAPLPEDAVAAFDRNLAEMLSEKYPEPLEVLHRVFVATGIRG